MTDFTKLLESGIEVNGVYQRVIPIICYIDIPIQMIIKKLELMDNKSNKFFEFLNSTSPVITNWIKSNPNETFKISNYINFLQTHSTTTRDFIRFALNSFPGIYVKIKRPKAIQVTYQTSSGENKTEILEDYNAKCFLHELDHLEGITFKDRTSSLKWAMAVKKSKSKRKFK